MIQNKMVEHELSILNKLNLNFQHPPKYSTEYENLLDLLNPIVVMTSQDSNYRETLSSSEEIWKTLSEATGSPKLFDVVISNTEMKFWYFRMFRGIILLARNLSVSNQTCPQKLLIQNKIIKSYNHLVLNSKTYDNMETALYSSSCEFLYNISKNAVIFDKTTIDDLVLFLQYPSKHPKIESLTLPFTLFFSNMVQHDDFLYYFLKHPDVDKVLYNLLVQQVTKNHTELFGIINNKDQNTEQISTLSAIQITTFSRVISNESFGSYLQQTEEADTEKFLVYLKIAQVICNSSDRWTKYELTGIMTWCFRVFEACSDAIQEYFIKQLEEESQARILHDKLVITLDIISKLAQFEHVRKFVIFYKGLERLISLLYTFQKNLVRVNFQKDKVGSTDQVKTTDSYGYKIDDQTKLSQRIDYQSGTIKLTNFPECKSLIVEILTFLTYENTDIQNKIRELQGLELILSNCVIDDNDPFIKERSIVCIRFLLQNNPENQDFVAKLEAKKAIQDDTLAKAGYEVKIDGSGNVGLASSGKIIEEGKLKRKLDKD